MSAENQGFFDLQHLHASEDVMTAQHLLGYDLTSNYTASTLPIEAPRVVRYPQGISEMNCHECSNFSNNDASSIYNLRTPTYPDLGGLIRAASSWGDETTADDTEIGATTADTNLTIPWVTDPLQHYSTNGFQPFEDAGLRGTSPQPFGLTRPFSVPTILSQIDPKAPPEELNDYCEVPNIQQESVGSPVRAHNVAPQPNNQAVVPVKLFVNRIPKWMSNDQLRTIFAPFGEVVECNILKGAEGPKGCAFVKYGSITDAYQAILHLHGKRVLNEETGPVQIKYADGEIARLGLSVDVQPGGESVKVFVGCLPKACTEDTLLQLFSQFGRVDEVFVLRDQYRQSKRSAFVTFPKMSMALNAIKALDRRSTLPGARRPLEVRLAESKSARGRAPKPIANPDTKHGQCKSQESHIAPLLEVAPSGNWTEWPVASLGSTLEPTTTPLAPDEKDSSYPFYFAPEQASQNCTPVGQHFDFNNATVYKNRSNVYSWVQSTPHLVSNRSTA